MISGLAGAGSSVPSAPFLAEAQTTTGNSGSFLFEPNRLLRAHFEKLALILKTAVDDKQSVQKPRG